MLVSLHFEPGLESWPAALTSPVGSTWWALLAVVAPPTPPTLAASTSPAPLLEDLSSSNGVKVTTLNWHIFSPRIPMRTLLGLNSSAMGTTSVVITLVSRSNDLHTILYILILFILNRDMTTKLYYLKGGWEFLKIKYE